MKVFSLKAVAMSIVILATTSQLALAANPEATKLYNQGIDAYTNGQVDRALDIFSKVISIEKDYSDAYYNMGSIYYQKRMYPQSEQAFRQAVTLNPDDQMARFNLGLALEKMNRYPEALVEFSKVPSSDRKYQEAQAKIKVLQPMVAQAQQQNRMPMNQQVNQGAPQNVNPQMGQNQQPPQQAPNTGYTTAQAAYPVSTFSKGFFGPTGITIGPGGYLYVANYSKNQIYRVGANGEKQLFTKDENLNGPMGLTYNPKRDELYVANYLKNTVAKIDRTGKVDVVASGLKKPYNLFLDLNSDMLYVSEQETSSISRIALPK